MPEPQYAYPYYMMQGRTQAGQLPAPRQPSPLPYYLPTITRQPPTYAEAVRAGGAAWANQNQWSYPANMAPDAPRFNMRDFQPAAPTAPQAMQLGAQQAAPVGTTPHGLAQIFQWANSWLGQAQAMGQLNQEAGRQYAPPEVPTTTAGGGGGGAGSPGGGGGRGTVPAPPGVNVDWYKEFQRQHGGQTPEQYYARTGEGLPEALADEEWGRKFAEANGRPPNDYEWRAHWFSTRVGYTPEEYERWKMRQIARQEAQRVAQQPPPQQKQEEQRPPVYMPQFITWR